MLPTKKKENKQKRVLGFASCLGTQLPKDRPEDLSTKLPKHEKPVDQLSDKPSEPAEVNQQGSINSTQTQIEASHPIDGEEQNTDDLELRKTLIQKILIRLEDAKNVILYGEHGVGKTWIAKEVTKCAILKRIVDVTIWVYHKDPVALYRSIAHQLSLQLDLAGAEYHLDDDDKRDPLYMIESLKKKLQDKKYLLVLDNENPEMNEEIKPMLKKILDLGQKNLSMVLITKVVVNNDMRTTCNDTMEVRKLNLSESKDLLQRAWNGYDENDDLEEIVKRCRFLPAAIVFTGNVLRYALEKQEPGLIQNRKLAIKEAKKQVNDYLMLGCCSVFEKFKDNVILLRCFCLSKEYLEEHGSINYNQLILCWILEGYFDNFISLDKAYAQAHNVLVDLLDAGLLGEREAGDVVLERAGLKFANYLFPTVSFQKFQLEFLCNFKQFYGGGVRRFNGSIASFKKSGSGQYTNVYLVALLIKGNSISKADRMKIFDHYEVQRLEVLMLSHVDLDIRLIKLCHSLSVLILRNALSMNYTQVQNFATLHFLRVLEISGCTSLEEFPKDFLANFDVLESLNLSGTSVSVFPRPSSRFALSKLRALILRRCTQLESFPDVSGLGELVLLDLSGAKLDSLRKKVWYLEGVPKLKILDLSETLIYDFPSLVNLEHLTHLFLKNCPLLNKVRPLTTMKNLQEIDASGSNNLHFFREVNLPSHGNFLRNLNLSSTMIRRIPSLRNASNLVSLCLKDCRQLKELPPLEGAKNLRLLDVSDAIQLEKINASFQEMKSLQELLLTEAKIKTLPPLSGLESLRKLILRGCKSLLSLPEMDCLTNLLLLDLQGCISMTPFDEQLTSREDLATLKLSGLVVFN